MPEVAVIGAGPAGSVAALLLARARWTVTLVEQHRFPRDKVCGECLSALGHEVLTRVGVARSVNDAGAMPLTRTMLHATDGSSVTADLPRRMWGLSRGALDVLLLDAAVRAGAHLVQPARCESVAGGADASVRVRDLTTNEVRVLRPRVVVLAEGKGAVAGTAAPPTGDFGIKTHFTGVAGPRDAIELFAVGGRYGGLAPIEGGRWNAAFSVGADQLRRYGGDVDRLFRDLAAASPTLARRLERAARVGDWLASPLPRFGVARSWPANFIPVGNAAAAIEPIGGEGMGLALRSAELAATALTDAGELWSAHHAARLRQLRALWRVRRPACRAAAVMLSSRSWSTEVMSLLQGSPRLLSAGMALVGK